MKDFTDTKCSDTPFFAFWILLPEFEKFCPERGIENNLNKIQQSPLRLPRSNAYLSLSNNNIIIINTFI